MPKINPEAASIIDTVVTKLIFGLTTGTTLGKQTALEDALRMLCEDDWVDECKREFKWKSGVRPAPLDLSVGGDPTF